MLIVFLGSDGAGKSAIINALIPSLSSMLGCPIVVKHLRPGLLPPLAYLKGGRKKPASPVLNPHGSKPAGFLGSLLRFSYYTLDYVLGYWLTIYPHLANNRRIYLFDRYYYDYFFDPIRSRISLPTSVVSFFEKIIPKPHLIFCLGTSPSIIYERKPELTLNEIQDQMSKLKNFYNLHSNAVWIDTGKSIDESVNDVLMAIEDRSLTWIG
jgi:thymidylate kinase